MSKGKGWDLTSLHSLEGAAEWIRKNSGALLVLVVRAEDVAFAVDKDVAPAAAVDMVELGDAGCDASAGAEADCGAGPGG